MNRAQNIVRILIFWPDFYLFIYIDVVALEVVSNKYYAPVTMRQHIKVILIFERKIFHGAMPGICIWKREHHCSIIFQQKKKPSKKCRLSRWIVMQNHEIFFINLIFSYSLAQRALYSSLAACTDRSNP